METGVSNYFAKVSAQGELTGISGALDVAAAVPAC